MEINTFAAKSASLGSFEHMPMKRYAPGDYDVSFDIKYSGICKSPCRIACFLLSHGDFLTLFLMCRPYRRSLG